MYCWRLNRNVRCDLANIVKTKQKKYVSLAVKRKGLAVWVLQKDQGRRNMHYCSQRIWICITTCSLKPNRKQHVLVLVKQYGYTLRIYKTNRHQKPYALTAVQQKCANISGKLSEIISTEEKDYYTCI